MCMAFAMFMFEKLFTAPKAKYAVIASFLFYYIPSIYANAIYADCCKHI